MRPYPIVTDGVGKAAVKVLAPLCAMAYVATDAGSAMFATNELQPWTEDRQPLRLRELVPPLYTDWSELAVGKSCEVVVPTMERFPRASDAIPRASSSAVPPRYVEKRRAEPEAFSFATKAS